MKNINKRYIFKGGDKVYNHIQGWLTISYLVEDKYCYALNEKKQMIYFNCNELSFTEYILKGFSQERPIELPEIGEMCLFSDDEVHISENYGHVGVLTRTADQGYYNGKSHYSYCKPIRCIS